MRAGQKVTRADAMGAMKMQGGSQYGNDATDGGVPDAPRAAQRHAAAWWAQDVEASLLMRSKSMPQPQEHRLPPTLGVHHLHLQLDGVASRAHAKWHPDGGQRHWPVNALAIKAQGCRRGRLAAAAVLRSGALLQCSASALIVSVQRNCTRDQEL